MKVLASQVVSYHFCQIDNSTTCLLPEFVHSLAAQLSQAPQLKAYHQLLSTDHDLRSKLSLVHCVSDPDSALDEGILQPLNGLQKMGRISGHNCLIIMDGLSDAEFHRPDYGDTMSAFIQKHLDKFPPWLKIVCTVRSNMRDVARFLPFHTIRYRILGRVVKQIIRRLVFVSAWTTMMLTRDLTRTWPTMSPTGSARADIFRLILLPLPAVSYTHLTLPTNREV